ncbi:Phosphatidylinositol (PI) 3-kinase [Myotisia sp. PD_48]|nr:Phosphatidylinositol (PI) 3-kinase [Myotisia sp. PD_48]
MDSYTFATSTQVGLPIRVKICNLEGRQKQIPYSVLLRDPKLRHLGSNLSSTSDLYVTTQLWSGCKPLGLPMQTAYKSFKNSRTWNEWLELPFLIKDAPQNTQLGLTIWDLSPSGGEESYNHSVPFGGTTITIFEEDGTLKKGKQKCKVYRHKAADGSSDTSTPSTPPTKRRTAQFVEEGPTREEQELERLEKLLKKHEMGEIPRVDWLDQLVFRAAEKIKVEAEDAANKRAIRNKAAREKALMVADGDETIEDEEHFVLYIEFPRFDFPVVFQDFEYPPPPISSFVQQTPPGSNVALKPPPEVRLGPGIEGSFEDDDDYPLIKIYDPEVGQKGNPCEDKHRRLVRSHRTGIMDRDLKPNPKIRDEINDIMSYGPTQELNAEEKDLVWKFRYYLTRDKRALTKFVKSVNWQDTNEARQAVEILPKWTEIDVDDALELLGPTFDNPEVRAYAVDRLRKSDDEELLLYLLQLVQALKFEAIPSDASEETDAAHDSSLTNFLISRAANNSLLGSYFHWYLMVECDDTGTNSLSTHRKFFARVEYYFMLELERINPDQRKILLRQGELIAILSRIAKDIRFARVNRTVKIEMLRKFLSDPKNDLLQIDPPLPLPLDPEVSIVGCYPDEANVFKSSLSPLFVNFKLADGRKYPTIFKVGDDLRQDQLVIQIITLMDRLLQKENLDLKLSPYRILATGANAGAVQFVPSTSLSAATAKYKGSLLAFLKANNPDESEPLGVRKEAMDTYIKSCAGYCVITYLLGVGDRHLDNLLLAPDGHFFHADFGFILGRDPKPFAPMMKLCKEMVEGMGGANSPNYVQFKQYCFTAYITLRKSANLILNLFSLMVDANIPDIRVEPDKAVLKVQERFHLEMTEEEAIRHFDDLIINSVNAIFGAVIDRIHDLVQGWRA